MKKSLILIATFCVLILSACTQPVHPSQPTGTISVAASFYPLAYFARQIGGGLADVIQVTPGGVEPHDYEPSPQQLASIHDARVFLMNGEGVDAWGDKIIGELTQNGVVTVRMVDTIQPMNGFSENGELDPTHPSSDSQNVYDPHIWLNPVLAEKEVTLIRDAFIQADPAHADTYRKNADAFIAQLADLDAAYRTGLAACAINDVVVSHNAFRYLAKEYGFQTLAIAGLDAEQEPAPKRIAELADFAKTHGITYIFFETLVSPRIAQTVADEIGAQSLVLNPIEGLTPDDVSHGKDYLSIMQDNLQNLRTAMQCQ